MPTILNPFARACADAVASALDLDPELFSVTSPPRAELGDFAVGCFPAAKAKRAAPAKLAADIAAGFTATEKLTSASAAGAFVNFRVDRQALLSHLATGDLISGSHIGAGKTICIDYSSPNISKHLAYHHIRSTVIGHALVNLYRAVGYRVVGINHLGDWGTTHGMLLTAYDKWGAAEPLTVDALNDLYVRFRAEMEQDPALEVSGRQWFKRLEDGDAEATRLWKWFRDVSWAEFESVYELLGIEFEEVKGESDFVGEMPAVLEMLDEKGLSSVSEGALVVALDDVGLEVPLMLKKSDGGTTYATRDLAAAAHRWNSHHFDRSLYVVDRGQGLHFQQLFAVLAKAGYDWADRCAHVPFGLIRIGGKKTGTRTGKNVVLLKDVLAEAQSRARETVSANNADMTEEQLAVVARAVGVGAVVFANLVSARNKDVDFEWEDVLATTGDTSVYLQYAHARACSVLRKAGELSGALDWSAIETDLEWAVARMLADFGDHVARAADSNDPHVLSRYLLDLAALYSRWYNAGNDDKSLRMVTADERLTVARVGLSTIVATTLATGLAILGLEAPTAM